MNSGIVCAVKSNCLKRNRHTITLEFELADLCISIFEEVVENVIHYNSFAMW
jgi:hypothetical protein